MPSALVFIAPFALLLSPPAAEQHDRARLLPDEASAANAAGDPALGWSIIESLTMEPVQNQVRIEQRVTIRISPVTTSPRLSMMPDTRRIAIDDLEERDAGKCIALRSIKAVQPSRSNRLLLFTRERTVMSLRLKKNCFAQDFYSGFYVEPRSDGMLCVDRDILRSRTGANCELTEINRLVADN